MLDFIARVLILWRLRKTHDFIIVRKADTVQDLSPLAYSDEQLDFNPMVEELPF